METAVFLSMQAALDFMALYNRNVKRDITRIHIERLFKRHELKGYVTSFFDRGHRMTATEHMVEAQKALMSTTNGSALSRVKTSEVPC